MKRINSNIALKKISLIDFEKFVKEGLKKDIVEMFKTQDEAFFVELKTEGLGAEQRYEFNEYDCQAKNRLYCGNAIGNGEKWREFVFGKLSNRDKSLAIKYIENAPKTFKKELNTKFGEEISKFKKQVAVEQGL